MRSVSTSTACSSVERAWVTRFDEVLRSRRLGASTVERYRQVAAHFFAWWRAHHGAAHVGSATRSDVGMFLQQHLRRCRCAHRGRRSLHENRAALRHLWDTRPVSRQDAPPCSPVHAEIEQYERYLRDVCGVAKVTRVSRVRYVGAFLQEEFDNGPVDRAAISGAALHRFVIARGQTCRPSSTGVIADALRSYVRYLVLEGLALDHLCEAIPAVARWRLATVPRHLQPEERDRLIRSFARRNPRSRRDYAITRCLMDLGLRAGEVAALQLEDIDWRAGMLTIRETKTYRSRCLPLPAGLARALISYLRVRPTAVHRHVFVRLGVLHGDPITASVVRSAVRLAYHRAGLPPTYTGTHRLRHSVATQLVSRGASLKEVADILGHPSLDSTAIYAKVDLPRLRRVALPWEVA
jgi:integrase/recombinase XerD